MRRVLRSRRRWAASRPGLVAALLLVGCHANLDPVRLGLAACSSFEVLGAQYTACEAPLDHLAAEQDCELRGAHLAALESADENQGVSEAIFATGTNGNVWLGGTRTDAFVWSWPSGAVFWRGGRDGAPEPDAFVFWQNGEPNNSNSKTGAPEACLALTAEGTDWNDRSCELALPYACELD
jgi:Lectin C-type domain